jgi:redox-sensitive bicupin YhaK (pirin superfamily)
MIAQSKGKIFLAEQRGHLELDWFRSYSTFNFGQYYSEHKTPFGALYVLNDETIAGGRKIRMTVEEDSDILLLPVVGSIDYADSLGNTGSVVAGQVQWIHGQKGLQFELGNPHEAEVRLIQIWMKHPVAAVAPEIHSFDLLGRKNRLIDVFASCKDRRPDMLIGQFDGREDLAYQVLNEDRGIFVFVIEGVFEVQYRLMQAGDGLALWGIDELQLEALSNDAILLMLEVPNPL